MARRSQTQILIDHVAELGGRVSIDRTNACIDLDAPRGKVIQEWGCHSDLHWLSYDYGAGQLFRTVAAAARARRERVTGFVACETPDCDVCADDDDGIRVHVQFARQDGPATVERCAVVIADLLDCDEGA